MPDDSEHAEFEKGMRDYLDAFNSGDYEKVASYWTEDAVSCPPMGEEIRGRAALREYYRQVFGSVAPRLSDYTFECRFSEDIVIVRESWRVTMNPPGQAPQDHRGRGLWAGRKEADGVWRTFWSLARLEAGPSGA
jgi:uncharacterized protein (TIGR02246 family)